jgi:hypothetical protein
MFCSKQRHDAGTLIAGDEFVLDFFRIRVLESILDALLFDIRRIYFSSLPPLYLRLQKAPNTLEAIFVLLVTIPLAISIHTSVVLPSFLVPIYITSNCERYEKHVDMQDQGRFTNPGGGGGGGGGGKGFLCLFFSLDVSIMSWTNKKKSCIVE